MGLDIPDLDDRTYTELVEDMRKRIPVHAEEWTDHNVHDPGITILELLAFLAETHTFQLDQVNDAHRRKYLELVDAEPHPPQRATVDLSLSVREDPAGSDDAGIPTVDRLVALIAETPAGREEGFRTLEPVHCSATEVATVIVEQAGDRTDHTRANETAGLHFRAFGDDPAAGDALYLGFEGDPFASPILDLWFGFHEANLPTPASHGDESVEFEPSLRCVWEHCVAPDDWYDDRAWDPIEVKFDRTNALYRGGRLRLSRPSGWHPNPVQIAGHDRKRHWIRCRLARLAGDDAPEPRYEVPPQLNRIDVNVVRARHERLIEDERVETLQDLTTAEPNQRFDLDATPVQSATVRVGDETWDTVADFDESTGDDHHVRLDRADGRLTFGDGRRGAIPPPWLEVHADYVAGGGTAGNLPADVSWRFEAEELAANLEVTQTEPPAGGREAESVESALARAHEQRRVPFRAVSADDHVYIATHTPGLRFGRAAVTGEADPVTVVVVPYSPDGRLPVPSPGFVEAVETHLCEHALITERLQVVGPTYVPVDVRASIEPVPGADREVVRREVREAVEDFLDPLDGFEGEGWPFARPVYHSELYELLESMDRVADAVDVGVTSRGDAALGDRGDTLPRLTAVSVSIEDEDQHCGRRS